jgi:release factor glutamine methyltransferase
VLIPRPETEHLFEHFCNLITIAKPTRPLKILDMCTGTGCIALLLDHHLNEAKIRADIIAIDKCDEAVSLASLNQREVLRNRYVEHLVSSGIFKPSVKFKTDPVDYKRAQVKELEKMVQPSTRVAVQQIDVFDDEAMDDLIYRHGPFDVIASNPPYVTAEEWNLLDKNVKDWEDQEALIGDVDGESDGLAFYRRIALLIKQRGLLSSKPASTDMPSLLVEVGHKQAEAVQDILNTTGRFSMIDLIKDPWQKKRGVMAWSRL